jgi:exodeoxyribonuclease VIII
MTAKLHTDMSIETYHSFSDIKTLGFDKAVISKSMLVEFMDCPARFKHKYIDGNQGEQKDFLNVGNAVHTLALEPELFKESYYILPKDVRRDERTEKYKEHLEKAADKTIIREQDMGNIRGMAKSLAGNKKARVLFESSGNIEASIFWTDPETGLKLRCRPDFIFFSSSSSPLI